MAGQPFWDSDEWRELRQKQDAADGVNAGPEAWEEPEPFDEFRVTPFDVDTLPEAVADYVEAVAKSTQTPRSMGGALALGLMAAAVMGRYFVEVTPDYEEELPLYIAVIARSGERKSPVFKALTAPVKAFVARERARLGPELAKAKNRREALNKAVEIAQKALAQDFGSPDLQADLDRLVEERAKLPPLAEFTPLVEGATPEALERLAAQNGGCLVICSPEGGPLEDMLGRYSNKPNFEIYLKGYDGADFSQARVGREAVTLKKLCLSIILTAQPGITNRVMQDRESADRGITARFVYVLCDPESIVGQRESCDCVEPVPEHVKNAYNLFMANLWAKAFDGRFQDGEPVREALRFSPEALHSFCDFQKATEAELLEGGPLEGLAGWGNKQAGRAARFAGILHAADYLGRNENPAEHEISLDCMSRAIVMAQWAEEHALAFFGQAVADETAEQAKYIWGRVQAEGGAQITRRRIYELCKGKTWVCGADSLDKPLNRLEEMGYLRRTENEPGTRGRRSMVFEIYQKPAQNG